MRNQKSFGLPKGIFLDKSNFKNPLNTKVIIFYKFHFWNPLKNPTSYLAEAGF